MSNQKIHAYRSCFIADVQIGSDLIRLQDTGKNFFFLDVHDKNAVESFRLWFAKVFLKGVAQTPSIFKYDKVDDGEGASDFYIRKFIVKSDDDSIKSAIDDASDQSRTV